MKNGFWRPLLAAMMLPTLLFGAANDIQISQKNSTDTAWAQRIIAGDAAFTTQAGFKSAIGLGTEDSPTFTGLTLSGLTGVLYGNGASALTVATGAQIKTAAGFPTSSTDNVIPRFDSTAGNLQTSSVLIDDASGNNVTIGGVDANTDLTLRGGLAGATIALGRAATGAIALTAQGTNQNITLTPSGTGVSAGTVKFPVGGTKTSYIGVDVGDANYQSLWLGLANATALTSANWVLDGNGTNLYVNAPVSTGSIFLCQQGVAKATIAPTTGSLLLGTTTDSSNGRIQLASHTTSAGGIGFGTDLAAHRNANGGLTIVRNSDFQLTLDAPTGQTFTALYWANNAQAKAQAYWNNSTTTFTVGSAVASGTTVLTSGNGTTALTLDSSQNISYTATMRVSTDTRSGAGAVSVTKDTTKLTSTGVAEAITLADGADGQIKRIIHDVDGGSMVLTPTTKTGWSTATFAAAGDSLTLEFVTTRGWIVMGNYGTVVAP